jgi:hypothetical protein
MSDSPNANSAPNEALTEPQRDLSQPLEGFVRKLPPGMAQRERSLMAKVYCEEVTARYQACLDANGFEYAKCKREEMHHYHCIANAYDVMGLFFTFVCFVLFVSLLYSFNVNDWLYIYPSV